MEDIERIAELAKVLEEYCIVPHAAASRLVELGYTCQPELPIDKVEAIKQILEVHSFDMEGYNVISSSTHETIAREILKLWLEYEDKAGTIDDGFGSTWSAFCPMCGEKSMSVVRPGKAQCSNCG